MSCDRHERALAVLVDGHWRPADLGDEFRHLPDVARVQIALVVNGRKVAQHLLWERPRASGEERALARTVRLGLLDSGVDALVEEEVQPLALFWGGRMAVSGPIPGAVSSIAALPGLHDEPKAQPPVGLLSLPVDEEPTRAALERGLERWARAVTQALAIRWPQLPDRATVPVECVVDGHHPPLEVEIVQPRPVRAPGPGTRLRMSWTSGRTLWANFAGQITLYDAVVTGLCSVEGDVEAFLWMISRHINPR